jgi:predicted translin family RNA/ssDNA-binding protein
MKLNKTVFKDIGKVLKDKDAKREINIRASRDVIALSKKVIYSVHRSDMKNAVKFMAEIKKKFLALKKIGSNVGITKVAAQEYVEAVTYYELVKKGSLSGYKDLGVAADDYLLGLADLSGELVRRAVNLATKKEIEKVKDIKNFIDDLNYQFLQFDLRDGELRKKADMVRWNLNKLEDVLLSASLR